MPAAPAVAPPTTPPASIPNPQVQAAGATAENQAASANGPMSLIFNVGGAGGLTQQPNTTAKALTGQ